MKGNNTKPETVKRHFEWMMTANLSILLKFNLSIFRYKIRYA